MLGIIKRNFNYLTISSFLLLYKRMVRSHLDYCSSVWVPYKKGDIELLERVEKRATKLIPAIKTRSPAIAEGPRDAGVPVEIW